MEKVGTIYVDAGCVMVGDPCYTQGDDATSRSSSWNEFLHKTWPNVFLADGTVNHSEQMADVAPALGEEGTGIVVSSGYGDGEYPVYVTREGGRIASLTVVFIGDEAWRGDFEGLDEDELRAHYEDEYEDDEFGDLDVDEDELYGPDPEDDETGN